jgi:hypothetical protein
MDQIVVHRVLPVKTVLIVVVDDNSRSPKKKGETDNEEDKSCWRKTPQSVMYIEGKVVSIPNNNSPPR